jgi:FixJ family two-component response regulator
MEPTMKKAIETLLETRANIERQTIAGLIGTAIHRDCPKDLGICATVSWHRHEIDRLRQTIKELT